MCGAMYVRILKQTYPFMENCGVGSPSFCHSRGSSQLANEQPAKFQGVSLGDYNNPRTTYRYSTEYYVGKQSIPHLALGSETRSIFQKNKFGTRCHITRLVQDTTQEAGMVGASRGWAICGPICMHRASQCKCSPANFCASLAV